MAHLFAGLSLEGSLVLEFVVEIEAAEAKGVWRLAEGHLHVRAVLRDVQVPRLPDWGGERTRVSTHGHRHHRRGTRPASAALLTGLAG